MQSSREILDQWWATHRPELEDELLAQVNNLKAVREMLLSEIRALTVENALLRSKVG